MVKRIGLAGSVHGAMMTSFGQGVSMATPDRCAHYASSGSRRRAARVCIAWSRHVEDDLNVFTG